MRLIKISPAGVLTSWTACQIDWADVVRLATECSIVFLIMNTRHLPVHIHSSPCKDMFAKPCRQIHD